MELPIPPRRAGWPALLPTWLMMLVCLPQHAFHPLTSCFECSFGCTECLPPWLGGWPTLLTTLLLILVCLPHRVFHPFTSCFECFGCTDLPPWLGGWPTLLPPLLLICSDACHRMCSLPLRHVVNVLPLWLGGWPALLPTWRLTHTLCVTCLPCLRFLLSVIGLVAQGKTTGIGRLSGLLAGLMQSFKNTFCLLVFRFCRSFQLHEKSCDFATMFLA
jgi:hypothetical protein